MNPFGAFSGAQLIVWLAIAYALLLFAKETMNLVSRARGKYPMGTADNPIHARANDRTATTAELAALEKRVEAQEAELKQFRMDMMREFTRMREDAEKRASRLMGAVGESAGKTHARMDKLSEAVAYMKGKIDTIAEEV
jgi:polyhydroxyalkanoate synthesis regulator phasin